MQIFSVPKILIIHLKRFKSGHSVFKTKLDTFINFPVRGLDLTEYVLGNKNDVLKKYIYDLFAVSNHYGYIGGGHYTAYVKNLSKNVWIECNDSNIK